MGSFRSNTWQLWCGQRSTIQKNGGERQAQESGKQNSGSSPTIYHHQYDAALCLHCPLLSLSPSWKGIGLASHMTVIMKFADQLRLLPRQACGLEKQTLF